MSLARRARIVLQRWRSLVRGRHADAALDEELQFHLAQLIAEKVADGLTPAEARRAAMREFGNVTAFTEASREARGLAWLHDLAGDMRYGWRGIRRAPAFSILAIGSLGLGIGGAATIAAAAHAIHWSPSRFPDADRLVVVRTIAPDAPDRRQGVTWSEFEAWRTRSQTLGAVALSLSSPRDLGSEAGGPYADRLSSQAVTPNLFPMLGVQPFMGRGFEDASSPFAAAAKVLIISHRLWQTRYGSAPDIIGRVVPTDGGTRTIIGVMPPDFRHDDGVAFWIPLIPDPAATAAPEFGRPMQVRARLRPGITRAQAERELTGILSDLTSHLPERFRGRHASVEQLHDVLDGWTTPLLSTLFTATALLLVIACANVTALLLARATTRQREVWLRLSLGASRGRVIRQLMTECALLAAGGGLVGLVVAAAGLRALPAALGPPPGAPRVGDLPFGLLVIAMVAALSCLAALLCGVPAALATVRRGQRATASASSSSGGAMGTRARNTIVAVEVALAMLLLVGAGLLGHSLFAVVARPLNFDPDGLGSFQFVVAPRDFSTRVGFDGVIPLFELRQVPAEAIARVHERVRSVPGITSIGGMTNQPVNSLITPRFPVRTSANAQTGEATPGIAGFLVTPDLFATLRTPILRGREVRDGDDAQAPPVVVINDAAARLFFPDRDPLGQRLVVEFTPGAPAREVIGVVANVPIIRRVLTPEPIVYVPSRQMPTTFRGGGANFFGQMTFMYRFVGDEAAVLTALRRAVADVDPVRPIVDAGVVRRALDARVPELATYVAAVSVAGVIALLLAAMGVYGVTAFAVSVRTREIAIRRALGAGTRDVVRVVGGRSLALAGAGMTAGLAASVAAAPLMGSQLVGVEPTDPVTMGTAALLLGAVAAIASILPARRAISVAPASVLKTD